MITKDLIGQFGLFNKEEPKIDLTNSFFIYELGDQKEIFKKILEEETWEANKLKAKIVISLNKLIEKQVSNKFTELKKQGLTNEEESLAKTEEIEENATNNKEYIHNIEEKLIKLTENKLKPVEEYRVKELTRYYSEVYLEIDYELNKAKELIEVIMYMLLEKDEQGVRHIEIEDLEKGYYEQTKHLEELRERLKRYVQKRHIHRMFVEAKQAIESVYVDLYEDKHYTAEYFNKMRLEVTKVVNLYTIFKPIKESLQNKAVTVIKGEKETTEYLTEEQLGVIEAVEAMYEFKNLYMEEIIKDLNESKDTVIAPTTLVIIELQEIIDEILNRYNYFITNQDIDNY